MMISLATHQLEVGVDLYVRSTQSRHRHETRWHNCVRTVPLAAGKVRPITTLYVCAPATIL
jgi:hypothetical protein